MRLWVEVRSIYCFVADALGRYFIMLVLPLYLQDLGLPANLLAFTYMSQRIGVLIGTGVAASLTSRLGSSAVIMITMAINTGACVMTSFAADVVLLVTARFICGFGAPDVPLKAYMIAELDDNQIKGTFGRIIGGVQISFIVATLITGAVYPLIGWVWMNLIPAFFCMIAGLVFLPVCWPTMLSKSNEPTTTQGSDLDSQMGKSLSSSQPFGKTIRHALSTYEYQAVLVTTWAVSWIGGTNVAFVTYFYLQHLGWTLSGLTYHFAVVGVSQILGALILRPAIVKVCGTTAGAHVVIIFLHLLGVSMPWVFTSSYAWVFVWGTIQASFHLMSAAMNEPRLKLVVDRHMDGNHSSYLVAINEYLNQFSNICSPVITFFLFENLGFGGYFLPGICFVSLCLFFNIRFYFLERQYHETATTL